MDTWTLCLMLALFVVTTCNNNIAIIESRTEQPRTSLLCTRKLREYTKSTTQKVLFSWYENPKETDAWAESKDCPTIYVRYLQDQHAPLPRKSRDSWWPLSYSSQKSAYQEQQFDIYYAGRSFYGIDNSKFTFADAKELDKQIIARIFSNTAANSSTRTGIVNHCAGNWQSNKHQHAHPDSSFMSSISHQSVRSTTMRRPKQSYISRV
eukprot:878147_1